MMLVHCGAARLFALWYSASSTSSAATAWFGISTGTSTIGSHNSACNAQPHTTSCRRPKCLPAHAEKICADDASSGGSVLISATCGALARRNSANAEK